MMWGSLVKLPAVSLSVFLLGLGLGCSDETGLSALGSSAGSSQSLAGSTGEESPGGARAASKRVDIDVIGRALGRCPEQLTWTESRALAAGGTVGKNGLTLIAYSGQIGSGGEILGAAGFAATLPAEFRQSYTPRPELALWNSTVNFATGQIVCDYQYMTVARCVGYLVGAPECQEPNHLRAAARLSAGYSVVTFQNLSKSTIASIGIFGQGSSGTVLSENFAPNQSETFLVDEVFIGAGSAVSFSIQGQGSILEASCKNLRLGTNYMITFNTNLGVLNCSSAVAP